MNPLLKTASGLLLAPLQTSAVRRRRLLLVALVLALAAAPAPAQDASAPALKAAFLYNFVKFAEWPAGVLSTNSPLVLCVVGDDAVADALRKTVDGHNIGAHPVVITRGKADALPLCHMLYASGLNEKQSARLLDSLKGKTVFTVSDQETFAQLGGVAHFFVENGKMRFAINPDAAQRAHLTLSSKLLSLAKLVKDERNGS
jgi:hypothetical protein